MSFFCLFPYFSQVLPNLVGMLKAAPDISSRGSFFKGQGHQGQGSNFCISAVLSPICMKLGECIHITKTCPCNIKRFLKL